MIYLKRAYEEPEEKDGYRILVDRLWPRGVSKEHSKIDLWLKTIAPSKELRQWYNHDQEKFSEFKKKYELELQRNTEDIRTLQALLLKESIVTFVYSAKDQTDNNAVVLKEVIEKLNHGSW